MGMFLDIYCVGLQIPDFVGYYISLVYKVLRIGIPILLIIFGMFDMGKAVVAKKEEDVKKYQNLVVKKILTGVLVFLIPYLVEFIFSFFDNSGIIKCVMSLLKYQ